MLLNAENLGLLAFIFSCSVFIGVRVGFKPESLKISSANWNHVQ